MKKYLFIVKSFLLIIICIAFTNILLANKAIKHKIKAAHKVESLKKLTCSCGQPTNVVASNSGGSVTVTWNVSGSTVNFSVGGYYQNGPTFAYCATSSPFTFYPAFPHGTLRVTANCNGTHCTDATCSGNPSLPATF